MKFIHLQKFVLLCGILVACTVPPVALERGDLKKENRPTLAAANVQSIRVQALAEPANCDNSFVTHQLPFSTGTRIREMRTYESNGAGVAVNDLDNDGDLDLVFASIDRAAAILWNQGDFAFDVERLATSFTRGVNIVDVDGDGLLDIVFTHRGLESLSYWRNNGAENIGSRFEPQPLEGVDSYAYSMAWADLNADGQLDLVTGSYNIDLRQNGVAEPADEPQAGVFVHTRQGSSFETQRLDSRSEALSIALVDLDDDAQLDIWVANDFDVPDKVWVASGQAWRAADLFSATSFSTMSIDWGDIKNHGDLALFTTDMMPYDDSPERVAAWQPIIDNLMAQFPQVEGDPQMMANVLQLRESSGDWEDSASEYGIEATGWSWAGKFGDLDNDGFLDLYVVNGMIAENMFGHLPQAELVEENQVFRNMEGTRFEAAPTWALNSHASGRGMIMADMDQDGDLDIVVSNLRRQAQLFENRLCGGQGLLVELSWPKSGNSRAIGAQLRLYTSHGTFTRDVRASGGYLSGDPAEVHFGLPENATIEKLELTWPDGAVSIIDGASNELMGHRKVFIAR